MNEKQSVEKGRVKLTRIGHPVFDGLGDVHGDPGALGLGLNGAGIDVSLGGGALLIGPQQLHETDTHLYEEMEQNSMDLKHLETSSPPTFSSSFLIFFFISYTIK